MSMFRCGKLNLRALCYQSPTRYCTTQCELRVEAESDSCFSWTGWSVWARPSTVMHGQNFKPKLAALQMLAWKGSTQTLVFQGAGMDLMPEDRGGGLG